MTEASRDEKTRVVDFMMLVIWDGREMGQGKFLDAL
jgi:hypothetical protein